MCWRSKGTFLKLSQEVEAWFKQAQANGFSGMEYSYDQTVETGHHRIENRQVWAVSVSQLPPLHRSLSMAGVNHSGDGQTDATVME